MQTAFSFIQKVGGLMSFNAPDTFDDELLPNSSKYEKILKKFLVFMPYVNVLYFHI